GQRENALQNGPALDQAAGAGLAFLVALLVLQNLLAVFKLPDFFQDFFALILFLFRLGGVVLVHIASSFGGSIQPRLMKYFRSLIRALRTVTVAADVEKPSASAISLNGLPSQNRAYRQLACRGVKVARASRSRSSIRARAASCSRSVSFSTRISSGETACSGKWCSMPAGASRE